MNTSLMEWWAIRLNFAQLGIKLKWSICDAKFLIPRSSAWTQIPKMCVIHRITGGINMCQFSWVVHNIPYSCSRNAGMVVQSFFGTVVLLWFIVERGAVETRTFMIIAPFQRRRIASPSSQPPQIGEVRGISLRRPGQKLSVGSFSCTFTIINTEILYHGGI